MGKYKKLLNDTFVFALGSLGSKVILFFLVPLYTNCLNTSQYGTVELIDTIVNLIMPITSMVIFDAVLRFTLNKNINKNNVLVNAMVVFLLGSILSVVIGSFLGLYKGVSEWKWFIVLYVISYMATQILMTYIKACEKSKLYAVLGLGQTAMLAILNIILLLVFDLEVRGYLLANIFAHIITSTIAVYYGEIYKDWKKGCFDKNLFIEMLKYSLPLIINNISWWVIQSSDKIMIDILVGSASLGLYSVATKIPALINVITSLFSQAWGISAIKEYDSEQDIKFYSQVFSIFAFVIFFFCACILIIVKPFMKIYVSSDFFDAWKYVPWLLVAASFSAISAFFGSIYGALKRSVNVMLSTLFSGIINIILNFLLIPQIGILGATLSTAFSYFFIALYRMYDTRRFFRFDITFSVLFFEYFIVIFAAYCVSNDWFRIPVSIMSCIVIFLMNARNIYSLIKMIKLMLIRRNNV